MSLYKEFVLDKSMPQNNKYSSTYRKVKSHLGHIKIENTIFFLLKTSMPGSSYKRSTFSKYFEKWRSLEKLTPVDHFFLFRIQKYFFDEKIYFFIQILKSFSKNRMNKKRKSLIWIYCQLFWNHSLKILNNKLFDFFQITHPQKHFGNVLFGSFFFNIQCMYIWHKMQLVIKKNILDLIAKKNQLSVHKLWY